MNEIARGSPITIGIVGTFNSDNIIFSVNFSAASVNKVYQFVFEIGVCCLKKIKK
jgi:hypothetical protein